MEFLQSQPLQANLGDGGDEHGTPLTNFVAPLTDLGLIAVSGDEGAAFLHNQLTNDVLHLEAGEMRLSGYCSPKGRLLAILSMWRSADAVMLQLPREIQASTRQRLQMFVLRSKAKLADVSDVHAMLGLAGEAAAAALSPWFPTLPATSYSLVHTDAGTLIREADADGVPRYQWITTPEQAIAAWPQLSQTLRPTTPNAWRLGRIHAGIPTITKPTQEQFVPQMVNLELIGGVNFKKGCYPGQEIVARTQYLGKLKRRMLRASIKTSEAKAGIEIFSSADPSQPCGMIVNAEQRSLQEMDCLVEIKTAAVDAGEVHLAQIGGAVVEFKPLPYTLA